MVFYQGEDGVGQDLERDRWVACGFGAEGEGLGGEAVGGHVGVGC